jgi:hypothetical protein
VIEHASSEAGDANRPPDGWPEGGAERHWTQAEEELRAGERDRTDAPAASATGAETRTEPAGPDRGEPQAGTTAR